MTAWLAPVSRIYPKHPVRRPRRLQLRQRLRRAVLWLLALMVLAQLAAVVLIIGAVVGWSGVAHAGATVDPPPAGAQRYRLTLRQSAQLGWGLDAPVAVFAAQVHQESRWRTDARSPAGAAGLAQFMPGTAQWIGGLYSNLADQGPQAATNPTWALRALVHYDRWLWLRVPGAADDCNRMAYTLSAYNGGLGWVYKRQRLSAEPGVCLGRTCNINPGITAAAQAENQRYPVVILREHQPIYRLWGAGVQCDG